MGSWPGVSGAEPGGASHPRGTPATPLKLNVYIAQQLAFNNSYLISTSFPVKAPVRPVGR